MNNSDDFFGDMDDLDHDREMAARQWRSLKSQHENVRITQGLPFANQQLKPFFLRQDSLWGLRQPRNALFSRDSMRDTGKVPPLGSGSVS